MAVLNGSFEWICCFSTSCLPYVWCWHTLYADLSWGIIWYCHFSLDFDICFHELVLNNLSFCRLTFSASPQIIALTFCDIGLNWDEDSDKSYTALCIICDEDGMDGDLYLYCVYYSNRLSDLHIFFMLLWHGVFMASMSRQENNLQYCSWRETSSDCFRKVAWYWFHARLT